MGGKQRRKSARRRQKSTRSRQGHSLKAQSEHRRKHHRSQQRRNEKTSNMYNPCKTYHYIFVHHLLQSHPQSKLQGHFLLSLPMLLFLSLVNLLSIHRFDLYNYLVCLNLVFLPFHLLFDFFLVLKFLDNIYYMVHMFSIF